MAENEKSVTLFRAKTTIPKYLVQSALFPVSRAPQSSIKEKVLRTFEGKEFLVQNDAFNQFDLAVSLAYKKIINQNKNFDNIDFTIANFASALNRFDGGRTRELIINAFEKSNKFYLCFDMKNGNSFSGFRLKKFSETQTNKFNIAFNMDYLSMAYEESEICNIDMDLFLELPLGLQSWLYGFISSIPNESSVGMDELYIFSGSSYKSKHDFKKAIKAALQELYRRNIIGWRYGVTRDDVVFWNFNQNR